MPNTSDEPDPRTLGFAVALQPTATQPRGVRSAPPPRPEITPPPPPPPERSGDTPGESTRRTRPTSAKRQQAGEATTYGTRRHGRVYVQVLLGPATSSRLDRKAETEDVVLGEILMDAVHSFVDQPHGLEQRRRRRRHIEHGTRRAILILPDEAGEIAQLARQLGLNGSALMRAALEAYLSRAN